MNKITSTHAATSTTGSLSRRSLFKLGGLATAAVAGASLAGCCAAVQGRVFGRYRRGRGERR